ncbi:MAG: hypothetical protein SGCHY_005096 [Lobulomycetales sp.]
MKQRFSSLDVASVVQSLQSVVNSRLQNIYDLAGTRTFQLKFSTVPEKTNVLVEVGMRLHETLYDRPKSAQPSTFVAKLRKHLRSRRLVSLEQLGIDRVVRLTFGQGDNSYHLILEFYAKGNIILTNHELIILTSHRLSDGYMPGQKYQLNMRNRPDPEKNFSLDSVRKVLEEQPPKTRKLAIKKALKSSFLHTFGSISTLEDLFTLDSVEQNSFYESLINLLLEAHRLSEDICRNSADREAYIFYVKECLDKESDMQESDILSSEEATSEMYTDFQPYRFAQYSTQQFHSFPNLSIAADEYFARIESQRTALAVAQARLAASKKLASVRAGQAAQISGFDQQRELRDSQARSIQANLEDVDLLILTIRGFLARGMDWRDLSEMVRSQARSGNRIALMVKELKLESGIIVAEIRKDRGADRSDSDASESSDSNSVSSRNSNGEKSCDNDGKFILVELDIYSSAYANTSRLYQDKKVAIVKQEKTIIASSKAVSGIEKKIKDKLEKQTAAAVSLTGISRTRKVFWWEKYLWFISSENFLVVGGKDASQNEILVKRYLSKGDVYVHTDIQGSTSIIVKNLATENDKSFHDSSGIFPPTVGEGACPIPPNTLLEAGTMSICLSKAWDSKIVTSAYWVYPDQVSKKGPSEHDLPTGTFMIRGKKNWLPPVNLVYGFGLLFHMDQQSVSSHLWDRRPWARGLASSLEDKMHLADSASGNLDDTRSNHDSADEESREPDEPAIAQGRPSAPMDDDLDDGNDNDDDDDFEFPDTQIAATTPVNTATAGKNTSEKYNLAEIPVSEQAEILVESTGGGGGGSFRGNSQGKKTASHHPDHPKESPSESRPVRGKHGKMKRMKKKYADQDEEDREVMREFLAADHGAQPKGKKAKAAARKKADMEEKQARFLEQKEARANMKAEDQKTNESTTNVATKSVPEEMERERLARLQEEEQRQMVKMELKRALANIDSLTGQPLPSDNLEFAIPVCAPWIALSKYKYKVKLLPGGLKKGKAAKAAVSAFLSQCQDERDRELLQSIPESDVIQQILGKCKLMGQSEKLKQKKK